MDMDPSEEVCKSLVKWLQTLIPLKTRSVHEISDGVAITSALVHISPENFAHLETKIKADAGNNWRLKVSNLKKINEAIIEFYLDVLNMQLMDIGRPDVVKLGETADLIQLGKLLRLLLGCAINCDRQQEYITQIMALEESVQQCIMQAIQQLEELTGGPGRSGVSMWSLDNETRILKLMADLDSANDARDTYAQQCHNLEAQVQSLQEEKQALIGDNQFLASQIREKPSLNSPRLDRRQMDILKEEIFKLETIRDDYRAKIIDQEKQIIGLQDKLSELQLAAETTSRLKDEVDALSETADKVKTLESAVASYKKKLEDYIDVKKQLTILEDKNVEYLQLNLKYEEELKKQNVWKNQSELYKTRVSELQTKLDEETRHSDKQTFLNKNLEIKLEALQAEAERTARERDTLREENEELRIEAKRSEGAAITKELTPTELKEKLRFLERENKNLRVNTQDSEAKSVLLEDALNRIEKLNQQNRMANQKILELESVLEDKTNANDYKQKIVALQETLHTKEQELQNVQAKYARNLEKAKEVALSLENKNNGELLRQNIMTEDEYRLIVSSFYHTKQQNHRDSADEKLASLSAGQGQSFLSRQRQSTARKPVTTFKSK